MKIQISFWKKKKKTDANIYYKSNANLDIRRSFAP